PPRQGGGARKPLLIMPTNVATSLDKELQEWCRRGEYPLVVEIPALDPAYRAQRSVDDAIRHAIGTAI
ncbi:MAG TPA: hypothetical protein VMC79_06940, partial [Rectinemataceae bacterium]|nr:hypothetical protein [Rectinemataceae bacterium]